MIDVKVNHLPHINAKSSNPPSKPEEGDESLVAMLNACLFGIKVGPLTLEAKGTVSSV